MGLRFFGGGNWCLLGTVMGSRQSVTQSFDLNGPQVFFASADQSANDIDLTLFDDHGNVVQKDDAADKAPFFSKVLDDGSYRLSLSVVDASALTLATMVVLQPQSLR